MRLFHSEMKSMYQLCIFYVKYTRQFTETRKTQNSIKNIKCTISKSNQNHCREHREFIISLHKHNP